MGFTASLFGSAAAAGAGASLFSRLLERAVGAGGVAPADTTGTTRPPAPPTPTQQRQASAEASRRTRRTARSGVGRRDTIVTGPLGLTSEPTTQPRILLGL